MCDKDKKTKLSKYYQVQKSLLEALELNYHETFQATVQVHSSFSFSNRIKASMIINDYIIEISKKNINVSLEIGFGSGENLLNLINNSECIRNFIGCEPYLNGLASFISNLEIEIYKKIKLFNKDARELLSHFS